MPHASKVPSHPDTFSSGASLGGTVSHYRSKQDVFTQGAAAKLPKTMPEKTTSTGRKILGDK
jgi:hypothetical protein